MLCEARQKSYFKQTLVYLNGYMIQTDLLGLFKWLYEDISPKNGTPASWQKDPANVFYTPFI